MSMVGRRKSNHHLPARMYQKGRGFYFVDRANKWHALGIDYNLALLHYAAKLQEKLPLGTVDALWLRYQVEELPSRSAATQRNRRLDMPKVLKVFGGMSPRDIKPSHIWEFWQRTGKNQQARHMVSTLSAVLSAGVHWDALDRNPCFDLRLPGSPPRTRYVSDEEYLLVRSLAPEMVGLAMDLALLTGARQGDLLGLTRDSVTETGIAFRSGKTDRSQVIEWNEELRLTVAACQRVEPRVRRPLLCSRSGRAFTSSGFQTAWQRLMRDAMQKGLAERFTFHDLRAKSLSDAGSLSEAQARGGHSDSRITDRVYRRLPKRAPALSILESGRST